MDLAISSGPVERNRYPDRRPTRHAATGSADGIFPSCPARFPASRREARDRLAEMGSKRPASSPSAAPATNRAARWASACSRVRSPRCAGARQRCGFGRGSSHALSTYRGAMRYRGLFETSAPCVVLRRQHHADHAGAPFNFSRQPAIRTRSSAGRAAPVTKFSRRWSARRVPRHDVTGSVIGVRQRSAAARHFAVGAARRRLLRRAPAGAARHQPGRRAGPCDCRQERGSATARLVSKRGIRTWTAATTSHGIIMCRRAAW